MDKSIVAVEEIERRTDNSVASRSKSLRPMVQINSIIDLNSAMEEVESPDVHEHFSIRHARIADLNEKPFMTPDLNENEEQSDPSPSPSFSPKSHPKNFHLLFNGVLCLGESSKSSSTQGQMAPPQARNSKLDGPSNLSIQSSSTNVALDVCSLNSNPADFGVPNLNNEFTISYRDLKLRKRKTMKARNGCVNLDGKKRKRGRKDGSD